MEIVAAISDNCVIGASGNMPWHLPADLKHFKNLTSGHAVIMGRRTWESIGRPLPNRTNIVLTRQQYFKANGATTVHSLDEAVQAAGINRVFIIGGGEIYSRSLSQVTHLHITRIHVNLEGDTYFPKLDWSQWSRNLGVEYPSDENNPYCMTFETWVRNQ